MVTVKGSIHIDRPVEDVYSFAVKPENVPLWSAVPLEARRREARSTSARPPPS
ncbi:MAG TPA: hypothetical protein VHI54_03135 [Actinomycetota bacterium]|nr:hypothetical protein [Actinomycetota bacterium]